MSGNPGNGGDGDDLEGRKTRFVPRSDIIDGDAKPIAPAPSAAPAVTPPPPAAPPPEEPSSAPAGTVIGRTRLMGGLGQAQTSANPASIGQGATLKMDTSAKTQYIRSENMQTEPVAGWVVIVKGPGRGGFRPVFVGMNSVGRDANQKISLSFGDESISREEHAFITYDDEQRCFYLQHGGKSNLVRLGDQPVLMPTELKPNDLVRIGKTTLRFVPCCGPGFSWSDEVKDA